MITREDILKMKPEEYVNAVRPELLSKGHIKRIDERLQAGIGGGLDAFNYLAESLGLNSAFYHRCGTHTNLILRMDNFYTRLYDPMITRTSRDVVKMSTTEVDPVYVGFPPKLESEYRRWINANKSRFTEVEKFFEARKPFLIDSRYSRPEDDIDSIGAPQKVGDVINCTLYSIYMAVHAEEKDVRILPDVD